MVDNHLIKELKDINKVVSSLKKELKTNSIESIIKRIPKEYILEKDLHIRYFYDKGQYLNNRFYDVRNEMIYRRLPIGKLRVFKHETFLKKQNLYNN